MDFMALIETAAGAIVTLAAVAVAALIVVKSINCFKKWTNSDNKSTKIPATKFYFNTATSRNQDKESGEKEQNTSKDLVNREQKTSQELGEKEQGTPHELEQEDQESHGELGEKEHEMYQKLYEKEQESRDALNQKQDRQTP